MDYLLAKNKLRRAVTHLQHKIVNDKKIIVSLTSYPARIDTVALAIRSLFAQTVLPDLIVLYLSSDEFPGREKDLPQSLRDILAHDVVVRWVEGNLKSHKKYLYAFQEFKNDLVITVDDDLTYPKNMIELLYHSYEKHPRAISASRAHLISFGASGDVLPYNDWIYEAPSKFPQLVNNPSMQLFATTGAGTLFPVHLLPKETYNQSVIRDLCLNADDVWLKCCEALMGIPVVVTKSDQALEWIPGTQLHGLYESNVLKMGNDIYLKKLSFYFKDNYNIDILDKMKDSSIEKSLDL